MILTILNLMQAIVGLLIGLAILAEQSGADGKTKRQEVIDGLQALLVAANLPGWAKALISMDALVGILIDVAVRRLNEAGIFTRKDITAPVDPTAGS